MTKRVTLYRLDREDIKAHVEAYFEGDELKVDGYDIGETVKEVWGDSDYEYVHVIPAAAVDALHDLLGVASGNRAGLLEALADRFRGHRCFSRIGEFLEENGVEHETWTWA